MENLNSLISELAKVLQGIDDVINDSDFPKGVTVLFKTNFDLEREGIKPFVKGEHFGAMIIVNGSEINPDLLSEIRLNNQSLKRSLKKIVSNKDIKTSKVPVLKEHLPKSK